MTAPNTHKIFCKSRFGFVKLALLHGAELVPMYSFGENEVYNISQAFSGVRHWLQRNLSIGIALFWGRGFLWMRPLETAKLGMEVGAPVPLPEKFRGNSHAHTPIAPSKEEIAAYHAAFVAAEERLFERTKSKHGVAEDVKLQIC